MYDNIYMKVQKNANCSLVTEWIRGGLRLPVVESEIYSKEAGGNFGGMEVFWILIVVVAAHGHIGLTKTTVHFCGWPLVVCKLNLHEVDLKEKTQEPT